MLSQVAFNNFWFIIYLINNYACFEGENLIIWMIKNLDIKDTGKSRLRNKNKITFNLILINRRSVTFG